MDQLSLNKIYLWKKKSIYTYPWQRKFLNIDFLKYEQKRIEDVRVWYNLFQKAKLGEILSEVYYYVLQTELSSDWKAAIALKGNYNYAYVSALKNCPQMQLIALFPKNVPLPKDYSSIRITKSKKDYIHNEKTNEAEYVINVESYVEVDPSFTYVDVPYERKSISKFIKENLINEDLIADSFQPTISGSPYVVNGKGGISLAAFFGKSAFSEELIASLKLMQPPEFSDMQFQIPEMLLKGKTFSNPALKGIKFNVAERSFIGKNFYSAFSSYDYKRVDEELVRRHMFKGEYSIACSLTPRGKDSELLRDILSKFIKTEIMQPFNTDELIESDVDLKRVQSNITEDLWLQVVNQKQMTPIIDENEINISKLRESLNNEWQAILDALGFKKNIEHEINVYTQASLTNIIRVAQSIARDEQLNKVNSSAVNKSFRIFVQNAKGLIDNREIQHYVQTIIPQMYESKKFNAVRAELMVNILTIQQLFENVKNIFNDIYELQGYIDKLQLEGYLFEPTRGFYKWI